MDSYDWNRLAAASVLSCCILINCWFISKISIPYSSFEFPAYDKDTQINLNLKTANISRGKIIAAQQCGVCHTFNSNEPDKIGPSLFNIKNRKIASLLKFNYSTSLKLHKQERWTTENLNKWLYKPLQFAPATLMAYGGLSSKQDRADIIVYINSLTDQHSEFAKGN